MTNRMKRRNWKGFTVEHFRRYYEDNYSGMSRSEVQRADPSFYCTVLGRGFSEDVFPLRKIKPNGYWKDSNNIQMELDIVIDQLEGRFPTHAEIKKMNSSLTRIISEHFGGMLELRKKYRVEHKRRPDGYWKEVDNVKKESDSIIEELGKFPTQNELHEKNPALMGGIGSHHGGLNRIRELYGEKPLYKPTGYYEDIGNVREELQPIIDELGKFPVCKQLQSRNRGLMHGIAKYHGGFNAVKIKLGYANEEFDLLKEIVEEAADE